jgi:hypothetical protein
MAQILQRLATLSLSLSLSETRVETMPVVGTRLPARHQNPTTLLSTLSET